MCIKMLLTVNKRAVSDNSFGQIYRARHCREHTESLEMAGIAFFIYSCIAVSQLALATAVNSSSSRIATPSNSRVHTPVLCDNSSHYISKHHQKNLMFCSRGNEPVTALHLCATFNEETRVLSVSHCPYLQSDGYNLTKVRSAVYKILPRNLSQLNDYMCGPLNSKGLVCSQCADGFGPSITSYGYRCVNCTDTWYRVPLFLLLEFVPITVFYLIVLVFKISVSSPPMPCFIMYAQLAVFVIYYSIVVEGIKLDKHLNFRLDIKILTTLYGVFNLDILRFNILPPFCLSSRLDPIDVAAILGYMSAFYPIVLIFLTWICVELHGRNFKPLVLIWHPLHKCFTRFRRKWNTRNDLIDVFVTFFFLSYTKIMVLTILFFDGAPVTNILESGESYHTYTVLGTVFKSSHHLALLLAASFISLLYNFLPLLLLLLYPTRTFRSCLSKLNLDFIAVNIFTDKVYGCYRNGLDGGRDMRRFASLYFFVRYSLCFLSAISCYFDKVMSRFYTLGTFLFIITLLIALTKPYKKTYMTILDVLFLFIFSALCYSLSLQTPHMIELTARILFAIPMVLLITYVTVNLFLTLHRGSFVRKYTCSCSTFFKQIRNRHITEGPLSTAANDHNEQPLTQPTCTVIDYGTFK